MPHVVILGGGFGGLAAANALGSSDVDVTVIDRSNHHLFQPLLYQVATAGLAPSDIAEPIRSVLARHRNVKVRLAEITEIDIEGKTVAVESAVGPDRIAWDTLICALGVEQSWFGRDDWQAIAPGLKSIEDALGIRRKLLAAFEAAEWTQDPVERQRQLTFVVVGGGPTGVELAGAISEIACSTFRHDFRNIDTREARIVLVEAGKGVLASYDEDLQHKAKLQLESLGVEVRLGQPVSEVDAGGVKLGDERIEAATVLWAAGMKAPALADALPGERDRAGRLKVEPDGSLPGHPDIFVAGDLAHVEQDGKLVPGVAPVAQGMGRHAAACVLADLAGTPRTPFRYWDKGQMATIGRSRAIVQSGRFKLSGMLAWLAWVFIHLVFLVTFRNRVLVMLKWAWAWLTYERASRLVWEPQNRQTRESEKAGAAPEDAGAAPEAA